MSLVAGRAPAPGDGFVAVFGPGKVLFVVALEAQIGLLCLQKLFCFGLMRGMAGKTVALLYRCVDDPAGVCGLVMTGVAEVGRVRRKQVLCVL